LSETIFWIWGALLGAGWTYKLFECALGMPKVPEISQPQWLPKEGEALPRISVIVPALNEQEKLEPALRSLLALDYPNYEVIAVDDRSTDCTGEIMDRLAREFPAKLRVVHVKELPTG